MPEIATAFVKSDAILTATADADIAATETVVVGGKTYTFEATPTDDGDVKHVTGFAANMLALQKAIGLTGVAGTDYDTDMTRNDFVDATLTSSGVVTFTARNAGVIGNLILITVGTSNGVVLSGSTGGALDGGTGYLDTLINDIQAESQINSDMIGILALLETGTKFA